MNLHAALLVLRIAGYVDPLKESYPTEAELVCNAINASLEGITSEQLNAALEFAFQDSRSDMQYRFLACLGFLFANCVKQKDDIFLACKPNHTDTQ